MLSSLADNLCANCPIQTCCLIPQKKAYFSESEGGGGEWNKNKNIPPPKKPTKTTKQQQKTPQTKPNKPPTTKNPTNQTHSFSLLGILMGLQAEGRRQWTWKLEVESASFNYLLCFMFHHLWMSLSR